MAVSVAGNHHAAEHMCNGFAIYNCAGGARNKDRNQDRRLHRNGHL